jgi:hypothetical protein
MNPLEMFAIAFAIGFGLFAGAIVLLTIHDFIEWWFL